MIQLAEFIFKDNDTKARFEAALHDKELPHTIYSVGAPTRKDQSVEEKVREKNAWQRVNSLKNKKQNR